MTLFLKMKVHFIDGKLLNNPLESATDKNGLVSKQLPDRYDDAVSN